MRKQQLCVSLAMLAMAGSVSAADETGSWYLNPNLGHLRTDSDRTVDDDDFYGLGIGKHVSREWSVELNAVSGDYALDSGLGDLDISGYSLDALRVFARDARVSPFLSIGAGLIDDDLPTGGNEESPLVQLGAGLLIDLASNARESFILQLRPEARARWDFIDTGGEDRFLDYSVGLGLQFAFGGGRDPQPEPTPVQAAPPPPPPPPPAPAAPPPPQDSDRDGVLDPDDQCPGTQRGIAVDDVGCPLKDSITLQGVGFEFDSARLTAESRPVLNDVAADLTQHPRLKVELQGHTDSRGADAYNLRLSQQRADAVLEYLVSQGVAVRQLTSKGYGESEPKASNDTEEGRAQNRRVDMRVLENPGDVEVETEEAVPVTP